MKTKGQQFEYTPKMGNDINSACSFRLDQKRNVDTPSIVRNESGHNLKRGIIIGRRTKL